jgi:hypothetical protein
MSKKKKSAGAPVDYEVGRGKPPRSSRFKPGQSGNPGGRKKGSLNMRTVLKAVLESEIEVTENGYRRKVPLLEAILLRQANEAVRGQLRAGDSLLDRYERHCGREEEQADESSEEDLLLLERAFEAWRKRQRRSDEPAGGDDD